MRMPHYTCLHLATLASATDLPMPDTPSSDYSRHKVTAAVGFGQLLAWGSSFYLLAVLAAPMADGLAVPRVALYAAFSMALVIAAAVGPIAGQLIDQHGGRRVLLASNFLFALALGVMGTAQGLPQLLAGWALLGVAMPMGLYDAAFSTLVRLYSNQARASIVGVTLIAGFASSVSWPLTAWVEAEFGWRSACLMWAALHLSAGVLIHGLLVPALPPASGQQEAPSEQPPASAAQLWRLALVFACGGFVFASMAAHLPRLLEAIGCSPGLAIGAAAVVGVAQVAARLLEATFLRHLPPMISAWLACSLHPLAAICLLIFGAPAAFVFAALHGAGIGLLTIVKGTLPLHLFGARGFGRRAGLLEGPSRVVQAATPILFGLMLDAWGGTVIWITGGVASAGLLMLLSLPGSDQTRAA